MMDNSKGYPGVGQSAHQFHHQDNGLYSEANGMFQLPPSTNQLLNGENSMVMPGQVRSNQAIIVPDSSA